MSQTFEFTPENRKEFDRLLTRYPVKRAAMLPTLHLAQRQHGFIPPEAEEYVAGLLEVPVTDVREVLTFYSLFTRKKLGRHHIRVCMSLSCWLRGAERVAETLTRRLGVENGSVAEDGEFSWEVVADCMGACEIAPMMQLDKDYHGPLTPDAIETAIGGADGKE